MKLYTHAPSFVPEQSPEQFQHLYHHNKVVSTESVSLFFAKIQDSFSGALKTISSDETRYVQEALSKERAAILQARQVKFQFFRHEVISKPESFQGYYTEYLKEAIPVAQAVSAQSALLVETLKMTVATFINEYNDERVDQIHGHVVYVNAAKSLPEHKKKMGSYFKAPSGKVKTTAEKVMKSMNDVEPLFGQAKVLAAVFSEANVIKLQREVQSVSDLIDTLIEVNLDSGVLSRSAPAKERLIDAIHLTAQYVEYYHVLLAQWVFYCKAFNDLTTALVKFPTQE
jgi:hypothetical protein